MIFIISPHFDDAVLSCWSVLTGDEPVKVLTVCGGEPQTSTLTLWDGACGYRL